jgi:acetyl-CoA synthetase
MKIERVFKSHPDVADCAAIGEEIEKDKLLVVTYILPLKANSQTLTSFLNLDKII